MTLVYTSAPPRPTPATSDGTLFFLAKPIAPPSAMRLPTPTNFG